MVQRCRYCFCDGHCGLKKLCDSQLPVKVVWNLTGVIHDYSFEISPLFNWGVDDRCFTVLGHISTYMICFVLSKMPPVVSVEQVTVIRFFRLYFIESLINILWSIQEKKILQCSTWWTEDLLSFVCKGYSHWGILFFVWRRNDFLRSAVHKWSAEEEMCSIL
jgi:hypothetical protein